MTYDEYRNEVVRLTIASLPRDFGDAVAGYVNSHEEIIRHNYEVDQKIYGGYNPAALASSFSLCFPDRITSNM